MNEILFNVLQVTVIICAFAITKYVIPYLSQQIKNSNYEWAVELVKQSVEMAEQTMTGPNKGREKKALVTLFIQNALKEINIDLSDERIDVLIESAVYAMNQAKKE